MRKVITAVVVGLLSLGAAGFAMANPPQDANGHQANDKGLCTAYFNGQKNGHGKNGRPQPGPFQDLQDRAEANTDGDDGQPNTDDDPTGADAILAFCNELGPDTIGGNPEHGRYPELFDGDGDGDNTNETRKGNPGGKK